MADDVISTFWSGLVAQNPHPVLGRLRGTVQFDLVAEHGTQRWLVTLDHGRVLVSQGEGLVDCVMVTSRDFFLRLIDGRANAMAGVLRGDIECYGEVELMFAIQRIFPGLREAEPPRRAVP